MGVFEGYIEQLVLFPSTIEETIGPPVKNEKRGK